MKKLLANLKQRRKPGMWRRFGLWGASGFVLILAATVGVLGEAIITRLLGFGLDKMDSWGLLGAAVGILAVAGLALLVLNWVIKNALQKPSTLYEVTAMPAGKSNWHAGEVEARLEARGHAGLKILEETLSTENSQGFDYSESVTHLSQKFQLYLNADGKTDPIEIVPNMLWPVAFGFGAMIPLPREVKLTEVDPSVHLGMDWDLIKPKTESATPAAGGRAVVVVADMTQRSLAIKAVAGDDYLPVSEFIQTKLAASHTQPMAILITAELTKTDSRTDVDMLAPDLHFNLRGVAKKGTEWLPHNNITVSENGCHSRLAARATAQNVASFVAAVLHQYPDAQVYLAPRFTKTIALAVGWLIAKDQRLDNPPAGHKNASQNPCPGKHCDNRLNRLTLLNWAQGKWQVAYVHSQQKSLAEQEKLFAALQKSTVDLADERTGAPPSPSQQVDVDEDTPKD